MLLALDMGNTNITVGVFDGKRLIMESRLATDHNKMEDSYAIDLCSILALHGVDVHAIDGAVLSSVVPPLDHRLRGAVRRITGVSPLQVAPGIKSGINIRIDDPAQLGADLLVGAVAALDKYPLPCIIWDLGTATTVSVLDKNGAFCGGIAAVRQLDAGPGGVFARAAAFAGAAVEGVKHISAICRINDRQLVVETVVAPGIHQLVIGHRLIAFGDDVAVTVGDILIVQFV